MADLEQEAERHDPTVERRIRILRFWKQAECDDDLEALVRVSRPMPQDREAGLENDKVRARGKEKHFKGVLLFLRFALNLFNICQILYSGEPFKDEWSIVDEMQNVTFSYDRIETCHINVGCYERKISRLNAFKLDLFFECVIGIPLSLLTICIFATFFFSTCKGSERRMLDWPEKERESKNWVHHLPGEMPWVFMFGPRISAGWSSIIFLQFASPRVMTNLLQRGDISFWRMFFVSSLCPFPCCGWHEKFKAMAMEHRDFKTPWYWKMCTFFVYFALLAFSLQALLVKITLLSYILHADFRSWTITAILHFLVFINQLVGSFDLFDPEFERVILFVFGQSDCVMQKSDTAAAIMYFRLLCSKVSESRTRTFCSRAGLLHFLSTLSSNDLQKMLLSPYVEKSLYNYTACRTETEKKLHTDDSAREFFNGLVEALKIKEKENDEVRADQMLKEILQDRKKILTELRDELIQSINQESTAEVNDIAERLRLASVVQEHMNECNLMHFAKTKDKALAREIARDSDDESLESESSTLISVRSVNSMNEY